MTITECVPLAGRGLIARRGGLVALTDGLGRGPDPLLAALDAVAAAGGDGAALLQAATRAARGHGGRPNWACAGVTFGGEVAVLAHGDAAAHVRVDGGTETEVTGDRSVLPVACTVTGAVVTVRLAIGAFGVPDPRLRLDAGTVPGSGVVLTVSQAKIHTPISNGPSMTAVPTARPSAGRPAEDTVPSLVNLQQLGVVEPVEVDGALCDRLHFNPPDATSCRECLASLGGTRNTRRQSRPPLGVLLVDDGRGYPLDRDYVIGREPRLDGDVVAGRATPLPVTDAEGSVSRLHLRVSLVGWRVEVRDLGSANGSVLYGGAGARRLAPSDVVVLEPGARVGIGRRSVEFLPYGTSAHGTSQHSSSQHSARIDGAIA
jgi:FHA domain